MTRGQDAIVPLCRACGYDLTGLEAPGICPECGQRFEELPGDEIVTLAWPCLNCGYPLAGFRRNQKCSECAMPVRISVDPSLMRFQTLEYRKRLRRGSLLTALGLASVILVPTIVGFISLASTSFALVTSLMVLGYLGMFALFATGWWILLLPPPATLGLSDRQRRVYPLARFSLIAMVSLSILSIAVDRASAWFFGSAAMSELLLFLSLVVDVLAFLAMVAFFAFGLLALRPIYRRSRTARKRPGLIATFTLWSGLGVAALFVGSVVAIQISTWLRTGVGAASSTIASGGAVLAGLFILLFGAGAIVVFLCYIVSIDGVRSSINRVNREILVAHKRGVRPSQTGETPAPASPKNETP